MRWNGKWTDNSDQLDKKGKLIEKVLQEKYKGTTEKFSLEDEDGTFFMCFSDFRKIFKNARIAIINPDNVGDFSKGPRAFLENVST